MSVNLFELNMFVPTKFYKQDETVWCVPRAKLISKLQALIYLTQDRVCWTSTFKYCCWEIELISKWEKEYPQPHIDDEIDSDEVYDLNTFKNCLYFYLIGLVSFPGPSRDSFSGRTIMRMFINFGKLLKK